jgi:hypothetical protein
MICPALKFFADFFTLEISAKNSIHLDRHFAEFAPLIRWRMEKGDPLAVMNNDCRSGTSMWLICHGVK